MGHQYRIQYQKFMNVMVLAEVVAHDARGSHDFVADLARDGYWIDDKTWIGPGCIQGVVVIA